MNLDMNAPKIPRIEKMTAIFELETTLCIGHETKEKTSKEMSGTTTKETKSHHQHANSAEEEKKRKEEPKPAPKKVKGKGKITTTRTTGLL